jgi:conjugative transposon TraK protein
MFTQFKNIDTAFKHIKTFSTLFLLANVIITCFGIYKFCQLSNEQGEKLYILYNGKVLEAIASNKKSNLEVELRDHIKTFHEHFFSLGPDDKAIQQSVSKSLYLADESAKKEYDNLKESGYYNNIISANISQEIEVDSIKLDINDLPYSFKCYATEKLIRATSTVTRKLITQGKVRDLKSQTDNNPHGFLIQQWEILENKDQPAKP